MQTRQNKTTKSRLKLKIFTAILGLILAAIGIATIAIATTYPKLPSMDELRNYQPKLPLQVYSADGVLLGQFGQEHRIYIDYNHTPKMLVNAILSAEDERFFKHSGIDYIGIVRATLSNLISRRIQSGASTITMQVAKNFFLSSKKTFSRKFNELLLAYKIEKSLTKEQILELYINQIFLGQRSYGFAEAALTYFGKPIDKLTIAEYAVLAGLPKAPSAYNPVVNKKRSHERQIYVLNRMKELGFINQHQYDDAINQKLIIVKGSIHDATDSGGYVAEMVRQMLYDKYGDIIYTQGYKVFTTIDSKMQQAGYVSLRNGVLQYDINKGYTGVEEQLDIDSSAVGDQITDQIISAAFDGIADFGDLQAAIVTQVSRDKITAKLRDGNEVNFSGNDLKYVQKYINGGGNKQIKRGAVIRVQNLNNKWHITQVPEAEGALVAVNPNDGAINTLVGGFDFTNNNFNHVTQAKRQPGSSFKPFIYSAALSKGFSTDTIIDDSQVCFPSNGSDWCPRNDDNDFLGPIPMREALALSRNIVTVKILNEITPAYAIDYVSKFGFNKNQFQPYLTMALGANEVTPLQMAQAFAVFASGGYMVQPYLIQKITDNKGNLIAKTEPVNIHANQPIIDPRNAYIINSILQDVVRYGTGARAYREIKRNDIAGKTGTTTDAKDVWFDGYTPNLVAITWIGYDQPKSLGSHQYGATLALPIWINFMQQALKTIPQTQLKMPAGITVKPGASWKGNDEYVFDDSTPIELTQKADASATINASSSPQKENSSSVKSTVIETNIDDLVKNIQD